MHGHIARREVNDPVLRHVGGRVVACLVAIACLRGLRDLDDEQRARRILGARDSRDYASPAKSSA